MVAATDVTALVKEIVSEVAVITVGVHVLVIAQENAMIHAKVVVMVHAHLYALATVPGSLTNKL